MRNLAIVLCLCSVNAFPQSPYFYSVVKGLPFSADGQAQVVRTLPDGSKSVTPLLSWKFYRDSEGRMRTERFITATQPPTRSGYFGMAIVEIADPVAHTKYFLDPPNKIAHTRAWSPGATATTAPLSEGVPVSIGSKLIEGMACEGTRKSLSLGAIGNSVTDTWKSNDLQLVILITRMDFSGENTERLFNMSRGEPPADLFTVPTGYVTHSAAPGEYEFRPIIAMPPVLRPSQAEPSGAYRIGGEVSAPSLTSRAEPDYPEEARKAKYSGTVLLSIIVDAQGVPQDIKVVRPLGLGLDQKAVEAVAKWRFKPGMKAGKPVPVHAQVEVAFRLRDN